MKYLLCVFLMVFSISAAALDSNSVASAGFKNLSDSQQAEIIKQVANLAEQNNSNAPIKAATNVAAATNEWLNIGERIGKGFAGAAKELGVAVNEFATTPVGILTVMLIVWHFMGNMMVHIVFGMFIMIVGYTALWYWARSCVTKTISYNKDKVDIFGRATIQSIDYGRMNSDYLGWTMFIGIMIFVTGIITTFSW